MLDEDADALDCSVRRSSFASSGQGVAWNDFGDYQQNYVHLNAEVVASRAYGKPVIDADEQHDQRNKLHFFTSVTRPARSGSGEARPRPVGRR